MCLGPMHMVDPTHPSVGEHVVRGKAGRPFLCRWRGSKDSIPCTLFVSGRTSGCGERVFPSGKRTRGCASLLVPVEFRLGCALAPATGGHPSNLFCRIPVAMYCSVQNCIGHCIVVNVCCFTALFLRYMTASFLGALFPPFATTAMMCSPITGLLCSLLGCCVSLS